jgi:uncharacterized protein (TIGR02145 family)/uncharacterized repeat protein (TIGR02543 family)
LPTSAEWNALATAVGGSSIAGKKLKSRSGWYDNGNGTDDYGFSALAGGGSESRSGGYIGYWWTADEHNITEGVVKFLSYDNDVMYTDYLNKGRGYSVRCVENGGMMPPVAYTITFNANGGTVSPTSGTTGADGKLASLPMPTRSDYTFDGWFTAATGGTEVKPNTVFSANTTVYARWTAAGTPVVTPGPNISYGGHTYKTVVIGGKAWMAENLNYQSTSGESWCYNDDNSNCDEYGRLYDWNTAKTVCPLGWHLPTRVEWNMLVTAVGGFSTAGKRLKATTGWNSNGNGTDDYGFSALPGGSRYHWDGSDFNDVGDFGFWWTATENGANNAYYQYISIDDDMYENYDYDKSDGNSVRCVQD